MVVPPSISTSASVPEPLSLVVINSFPVNALPVSFSVIVALSALVARVVVPVIVRAPLCVIFPVVAVALNAPSTVIATKSMPEAFTMVTMPVPCGSRI